MEPTSIALIIALIFSVILHEMAHGYAANWLGDPTARLAGRLTANPIPHIDPLMSVIIPGILVATGSPLIFGAAKPVPYNPYNLRNQKWGEAIVAAAGPAMNILLAVIFALLIRYSDVFGFGQTFMKLSFSIVILNIFLAFFNLLPIPPLDGSKILPRLLPLSLAMKYEGLRRTMEVNTGVSFFIIIFLFVFVFANPIYHMTLWFAQLLIGG